MPELPEVETIRSDLESSLVGESIREVHINLPKIVVGSSQKFTSQLTGAKVASVNRRGKLLYFTFSNRDFFLLVHLKMTGQVILRSPHNLTSGGHNWPPIDDKDLPGKHTHAWLKLSHKKFIYYNDQRQFGYLKLATKPQLDNILSKFGPEPFDKNFSPTNLYGSIHTSRRPIKAVLLDQSKIAGLGNIYVDEVCFATGIRPQTRAHKISQAKSVALHQNIKKILKQAIKYRGTTFSDFRDLNGNTGNYMDHLKAYGRAGETCLKCRTKTIKKIQVAQRGTHYCPQCQK